MAMLHLANGEQFDTATLVDGTVLTKVTTTRSSGYDVRIFVVGYNEGSEVVAPIEAVVKLVRTAVVR